ncbi:MAG: deoxyribonuclease IV [Bacilli bacterium]|nr:deoxyribonuclease IV [Bacilli bacterium]
MILGSHVSFKSDQLLGSVKEAISYNANTFMFYTGAPQNTLRNPINDAYTKEAIKLMDENNIDINKVICHAPYIINLADYGVNDKYQFGINFLIQELKRIKALGVKYLVVHPGSSLKLDRNAALKAIGNAFKRALNEVSGVYILVETMAGKGSECGINLEEIKLIIDTCDSPYLKVCLDTCHLNDSGININEFDKYLDDFDQLIGIDKIGCVHLNDSKNELGAKKDRHENIGFGTIGFDALVNVLNNERLKDVPKILETPYLKIDDKTSVAPYKEEIAMLKSGKFNPNLFN